MDDLIPWISLKDVQGVGNLLYKRLIDRFQSPEAVFASSFEELAAVDGISDKVARSIHRYRTPDWVYREVDAIRKKSIRIVTLHHSAYPILLKEIPDPPPFLYVYGVLQGDPAGIAVVGSRNATEYGLRTTGKIAGDLAAAGVTVVSGMARGIDTAAHRGALRAGGFTVAVLGSGFDHIYPLENRRLFHEIAEQGAVITEFPMAAEPDAHHFPMRNRIISGICLGTVVVEATRRSGSLITARLALEQGREVFAVPGSIHSFKSTGTHTLIKQGAKLVENAQDVLIEIQPMLAAVPIHPSSPMPAMTKTELPILSEAERCVFEALKPTPLHIDEIARATGLAPGNLSGILLGLELKGLTQQLAGKRFALPEDYR